MSCRCQSDLAGKEVILRGGGGGGRSGGYLRGRCLEVCSVDEGIGFRKHTEDSRLVWQGGVISTVSWGLGPVGRAVKAWGGGGLHLSQRDEQTVKG